MTLELFRRAAKAKVKEAISVFYDNAKDKYCVFVGVARNGQIVAKEATLEYANDCAAHMCDIITDLVLGYDGVKYEDFGVIKPVVFDPEENKRMEEAAMKLAAEEQTKSIKEYELVIKPAFGFDDSNYHAWTEDCYTGNCKYDKCVSPILAPINTIDYRGYSLPKDPIVDPFDTFVEENVDYAGSTDLEWDKHEAITWARYHYNEPDLTWEELASSIDFVHCYVDFETPYHESEFVEVVLSELEELGYMPGPLFDDVG